MPYGDKEFYQWSRNPKQPGNSKWYQAVIEKSLPFYLPVKGVPFLIVIIDFSNRKYLFVSESAKSVTGYAPSDYMKGGMTLASEIVFAEDHPRFKQMHMDIFDWHFSKPITQRTAYRYSQQFRIVRKDGRVIWFETQDFFLELDSDGKPLIVFELCMDVTHLKTDLNLTLKISKVYKNGEQKLMKQFIYPWKSQEKLTSREIQILELLSKGLGTKQIARNYTLARQPFLSTGKICCEKRICPTLRPWLPSSVQTMNIRFKRFSDQQSRWPKTI